MKAFNKDKKSGFTLVEMAIVVLILGLIIGSISSVYSLQQKKVKIETTNDNLESVSDAVGAFRATRGRYPCPASLTVSRNKPNYGRENCRLMIDGTTGTTPTENEGIGIQPSIRMSTDPGVSPLVYDKPISIHSSGVPLFSIGTVHSTDPIRVATGAIPFRTLNIEENQAEDAYGNRLIYAVTEHLAFADSFQVSGGGIEIRDDSGDADQAENSALGGNLTDIGTGHFLIYSTGENGAGGFSREGFELGGCPPTGSKENQNCDFDDAIFNKIQKSDKNDSNQSDDSLIYSTQKEVPLWKPSKFPQHTDDVIPRSDENVGFGFAQRASIYIEEELQVTSTLRVADDPSTEDVKEGLVKAVELCPFTGGGDCFSSYTLGGVIDDNPQTPGGLTCDDPEAFITGIAHGKPICQSEIIFECNPGQFMTGINPNGTPGCSGPPPEGCEPKDVDLCPGVSGTTRSLPAAQHGERVVIRTGDSVKQEYRCNAGTWEKYGGKTGDCTCTETPVSDDPRDDGSIEVDCSKITPAGQCGNPWTGTKRTITANTCPGNIRRTTDVPGSGSCTCVGSHEDTGYQACPNDMVGTKGIKYRRYFDCNMAPLKCRTEVLETDCKCVEKTEYGELKCGIGYALPNNTYRTIKRELECLNGEDKPGTWKNVYQEDLADKAAKCSCSPGPTTPLISTDCGDGYTGSVSTPQKIVCNPDGSAKVIIDDSKLPTRSCTKIKDMSCKWYPLSEPQSTGTETSNNAGNACDCLDPIRDQPCKGGEKFYAKCQCTKY